MPQKMRKIGKIKKLDLNVYLIIKLINFYFLKITLNSFHKFKLF